jgi:hypothetical protein
LISVCAVQEAAPDSAATPADVSIAEPAAIPLSLEELTTQHYSRLQGIVASLQKSKEASNCKSCGVGWNQYADAEDKYFQSVQRRGNADDERWKWKQCSTCTSWWCGMCYGAASALSTEHEVACRARRAGGGRKRSGRRAPSRRSRGRARRDASGGGDAGGGAIVRSARAAS